MLIGSFKTHPYLTMVATTGVIFAAAYLLWAIQRILFNALDKPANAHLTDLNRRELALMIPLVVVIIWITPPDKPWLVKANVPSTMKPRWATDE